MMDLYFKRYRGSAEAKDYIAWATGNLYKFSRNVKVLAGMSLTNHHNLFEIEEIFQKAMQELGLQTPAELDCVHHYVKKLHMELLYSGENAISVVREIYQTAITYELSDLQEEWQELSDATDDYLDGDNSHAYTKESLQHWIVADARKRWQLHIHPLCFDVFIEQKIVSVDTSGQLTLEFERGFLTIECPWRIRNAEMILLGETDIKSNAVALEDAKELLVGKQIKQVLLLDHCPLLIVQADDVFLDLFHASSYFDGWTIGDEEELYLFSMHGGSIT
ncbi:hypothetical protein GIW82_08750 [Planomicrobium sp. YIM 101495]|nr:hypothetical protein [Planomicrobium sp. YIM 101495]